MFGDTQIREDAEQISDGQTFGRKQWSLVIEFAQVIVEKKTSTSVRKNKHPIRKLQIVWLSGAWMKHRLEIMIRDCLQKFGHKKI